MTIGPVGLWISMGKSTNFRQKSDLLTNLMEPLVSIIITTYNRAKFLRQAVQSCVDQTYPELEILVIDDGSTDDSARKVCQDFPGVRYTWQANQGAGGARNTGIRLAAGEFIQFLDDDDWLEKECIQAKMEVFAADSGCDAVYSDVYIAMENEKIIERYYSGNLRSLPEGNIFSSLVRRNFILLHALLWKKAELVRCGGFPIRTGEEDWELLVKAARFASFRYIDQPLGTYRLHGNNETHNYSNLLACDAEVQKVIISCPEFEKLPRSQRVDAFFHYCLRQWCFGDSNLAMQYFAYARALNASHPKVVLLRVLFALGRSGSRRLLKLYWRGRGLVTENAADRYFLGMISSTYSGR